MALRKMAVAAVVELKHRITPPLMVMTRILHRDPSSSVRRFGTPALGRNLDHNNVNGNDADEDNLMLVVDRGTSYGLPNSLSVLSIENKSLESVQPNRPNFSRLNTSACYEYLGAGDRWVVMRSKDEGITTPAALLWDPTTDEVRPLPQFQVKPRLPLDCLCYPYEPHPLWGVGFDPCSGDYKVVRCSELEYVGPEPDDIEVRGELLSVGTGSWREIRFPHDTEDMSIDNEYCIHINGFYYWPAFLRDVDSYVIIPFDFGREEFPADLIPMPKLYGPYRQYMNLVLAEHDGSLAVIFQDDKHCSPSNEDFLLLQIWVWNNGDRSWSHLATVHFPASADIGRAVGLYNNDKVILLDSKGAILLYDLWTTKLESFGVTGYYKDVGFSVYPHYAKSKINRSEYETNHNDFG